MEVIHFNQRQLAARWAISEATLERGRSEGIGPKLLKPRRVAMCPLLSVALVKT